MKRLEQAFGSLLLAAGLAFAGGGDAAAQAVAPSKSAAADRQELAKYGAYVDATGDVPIWHDILKSFRRDSAPKIERGDKLVFIAIERDIDIDIDVGKLDAAMATPGTLPDIDPAAKALSNALKAFSPISHDFLGYANSQGFLADKGKKAREIAGPYMAALQAVADAQDQLADRLDARDIKLVAAAFARAPKDSPLFYAAGMTYFGKRNVMDSRVLFKAPEDAAALAAFQKSTEQFAGMATSWEKEMHKDRPQGCVARMVWINFFVGKSREIGSKLSDGSYAKRAKKNGETLMTGDRGGLDDDIRQYGEMYHSVVEVENQQMC